MKNKKVERDTYYYSDGTSSHHIKVNKIKHRVDGPAVEKTNGYRAWYKNGIIHREGGPARIRYNGTKEWYKDGKLHREDGPAKVLSSGEQQWWFEGKRHREDGPAVISGKGAYKEWWVRGRRHRIDGPAQTTCYWNLDGNYFSEEEHNKEIEKVNNMDQALQLTDSRWWVREIGKKK